MIPSFKTLTHGVLAFLSQMLVCEDVKWGRGVIYLSSLLLEVLLSGLVALVTTSHFALGI